MVLKYPFSFVLLLILLLHLFIGSALAHGGMDMPGMGTQTDKNEEKLGYFEESEYNAYWRIYNEWINITVSAPTKGWIAIGFADGAGYDFVLGYLNESKAVVVDMYAADEGTQWLVSDESIGGTYDIFLGGVEFDDEHGTTALGFSRKLDTGDSKADTIISDRVLAIKWAFGDDLANLASNATYLDITKATQGSLFRNFYPTERAPATTESPNDKKIRYHGVMMLILVMLLMTAQIITSRYLKRIIPWWFYLHALLAIFSLSVLITSLVTIFEAHGNKFYPSWHSAFGIIFIIGIGLQNLLGLYSHFKFDKNRRDVPVFPDKSHWWLGRVVYIEGIITLGLGFGKWGVSKGGWLFYALWWIVVVIVFTVLDKQIGQTHEHVINTHRVLEPGDDLEKVFPVRPKQQNPSGEFLVMLFVPIVTLILMTFFGAALSL